MASMFVSSGSKKQLEIQTESIKSLRIEKRKLTESLHKYEAIEGAMSELDNSQYLNIWTGEIVSANGNKYEVTIEKT
ncbi:hypothetical protein ACJQWY_01265 [Weissella kandleri]|uniref:hypothetical protein n=1 Tax=Weissella kandleri TaxID=1616 RepID=UPI00387E3F21